MDSVLLETFSPYPFIFNGQAHNSSVLPQNRNCEKCKEKECWDIEYSQEFVCKQQYNCVSLFFNGNKVIINGIIFKDNKTISPERRSARKDWIVDRIDFEKFLCRINVLTKYIKNQEIQVLEQKNHIYHDFRTSLNVFYSCTQEIINKLEGNTFEDKLKNSEKIYQDLYDSLGLISSQLGMFDVVINPKSIEFGRKREINLHQLFLKMRKLFEHLSSKKNINISINNMGWVGNSLCYSSIEFIPLILLDNAIKYSVPNTDIEIRLRKLDENVKISVGNIGPLVADENNNKIFEKFYRDEKAQEFSENGIGIGLWVAQQILHKHNSCLYYRKGTDGGPTGGIGLNIFEFTLPMATSE